MFFEKLLDQFARMRVWLTLDGRIRVAQPLMLAMGPALLLVSLVVPYRWLYFLVYSYVLLALVCYIWVRVQAPRIALTRHLQDDWAQVGDELKEHWTLINDSWLPLLWLELDDASEVPGYSARRVAACGISESQQWYTSAICVRRGLYSLGPLRLRLSDPFGVFEARWLDSNTRRIAIYPPLVRLPPFSIPQGQRGGLARADLLQQFATPSVAGLREYRPGDVPSHIHWPTVARKGILMVKEFDQERAGAVWIVLDLCRESYEADRRLKTEDRGRASTTDTLRSSAFGLPSNPALELSVVLAASLAAQLLGEGRSVGLLADDGRARVIAPGQGPRQLWQIMGALVDVQAIGSDALDVVLRRWRQGREQASARNAALTLVTPDLGGTWLSALAEAAPRGGALALLIGAADSATSSAPAGARTDQLRSGLAALGVTTHMFSSDTELPRLDPPRPRDEIRVTPLGRAVRIRKG